MTIPITLQQDLINSPAYISNDFETVAQFGTTYRAPEYSFVSGSVSSFQSTTTIAHAIGTPIQVNDDIFISIVLSATTITLNDSLGNTYTSIFSASANIWRQQWYTKATSAGTFSVTASLGASRNGLFVVDVFRGGGSSNTLVGTTVGNYQHSPGTGSDVITSTNHAAPGSNNCLVYGVTMQYYNNPDHTIVPGTGFTQASVLPNNGVYGGCSEYLIQTTSAPIAATFTDAVSGSAANAGYSTICTILSPAT